MRQILFFLPRVIFVFIFSFIIFSLIRTRFFKEYKYKSNSKREFVYSLFAGYASALSLILFMPNAYLSNKGIELSSNNFDFIGDFKERIHQGNWGVNIVPFRTIKNYINYSASFHIFSNIIGNILIFIPLAYMLIYLYKPLRNLKKFIITLTLISFFIEFFQFFMGRSVDIDDIILNLLGGLIAYLIFNLKSDFDQKD